MIGGEPALMVQAFDLEFSDQAGLQFRRIHGPGQPADKTGMRDQTLEQRNRGTGHRDRGRGQAPLPEEGDQPIAGLGAFGHEAPALRQQGLHGDGRSALQRMAGADDHVHAFVPGAVPGGGDARGFRGLRGDHQIDLVSLQAGRQFIPDAFHDVDGDAGPAFQERAQRLGDEERGRARGDTQAQRAHGQAAHAVDFVARDLLFAAEQLRMRGQRLAIGRQAHAAGVTLEQRLADGGFQTLDDPAQRRLREAEFVGGLAQRSVFDDGEECAQFLQVVGHTEM